MQTQFAIWERLVEAIKQDVPGFEVVNKKSSWLSKLIAKVAVWMSYMDVFTTIYPRVFLPDRPVQEQFQPRVLEHEWVHLKDQGTMFGLVKTKNRFVRKMLSLVWVALYFTPQTLAVFAALAFVNLWWLLALLFLLPLPSPFRMWAEMRAHRRTRELGFDKQYMVEPFTKWTYYLMWPFKRHVLKMLDKPSPYKDEMDKARL